MPEAIRCSKWLLQKQFTERCKHRRPDLVSRQIHVPTFRCWFSWLTFFLNMLTWEGVYANICIHINIYMCVWMCMCMCVREYMSVRGCVWFVLFDIDYFGACQLFLAYLMPKSSFFWKSFKYLIITILIISNYGFNNNS